MDTTYLLYTPEQWTLARPTREHLAHYITYQPNVLPDGLCDQLVAHFDGQPERQVERTQGGGHFRFMQTDVTEAAEKDPEWYFLHKAAFESMLQGLEQYKRDIYFDGSPQWPGMYGYEHLRINRTLNNGKDGFGNHVDVGDYASARRFLTVLFYLTEVEDGGGAAFPALNMALTHTKGAMLCFPSTWTYLHCGLKPISAPKYIMTSFLHYY